MSKCACVESAIKAKAFPHFSSRARPSVEMKALILFGLVLVVAESVFAENGKDGAVVSMDSGVSMANAVFQEFMENTYNGNYHSDLPYLTFILKSITRFLQSLPLQRLLPRDSAQLCAQMGWNSG